MFFYDAEGWYEPLSASQIETYLLCPRKWAWQYIEHVRREQGKGAGLGSEIHEQLENYLRDGISLDFTCESGEIAFTALEFLPEPPQARVEEEFLLISERHAYYGLKDLSVDATHTTYDHKSSSNPRLYGKKAEKLKFDVQAVLYATHAIVQWKVSEVNLQWTYMSTKGRRFAYPVRTTMSVEDAATGFEEIERIADEMVEVKRTGKRALDLAPNVKACRSYGGCPFEHLCNLSPLERMKAVMSTASVTADLMARLGRLKGQDAPKDPEPVGAPEHAINPPEANVAPPSTTPDASKDEPIVDTTERPTVPAPPPATKRKYTRKAPPAGTKTNLPIGTLYVNALVVGSEDMVPFEVLVARANELLAQTKFEDPAGSYQVPDFRLVKYGQGPAVLLSGVLQALAEHGRVEELVVSDASTPEANACLNALLVRADRVVRGTR